MNRAALQAVAAVVLVVFGSGTIVASTGVANVDADGIPAAVELVDGTNPLALDTDGDGVADDRERELGLDPTDADSNDEESDENPAGTEPSDGKSTDSDGDGLSDDREQELGTDPDDSDTDGDGLSDGREVELGTGPTSPDTDGDGLRDGTELDRNTDPTVADTDGDGLQDGEELEVGTDPTVADTDEDGLQDGREVTVGTQPLVVDTDEDGLQDGREVDLGTDPTEADTDGDDLEDGWEVADETPSGVPLPEADPVVMDIYVKVFVSEGASGLSNYNDVRAAFSRMPVENPDGSEGVELHVVGVVQLSEKIVFDGTGSDFDRIMEQEIEPRMGEGEGVYHATLFSTVSDSSILGYGSVGGYYTLVAGEAGTTKKEFAMVHELLHNVVGEVHAAAACDDGNHYCDGGWLVPRYDPDENYLPVPLADQLEDDGFAT